MCLPHRCVATSAARTIEKTVALLLSAFASAGNVFTYPLLSNERFRLSGFMSPYELSPLGFPIEAYINKIKKKNQFVPHRKHTDSMESPTG
jgi:hypothetical protein